MQQNFISKWTLVPMQLEDQDLFKNYFLFWSIEDYIIEFCQPTTVRAHQSTTNLTFFRNKQKTNVLSLSLSLSLGFILCLTWFCQQATIPFRAPINMPSNVEKILWYHVIIVDVVSQANKIYLSIYILMKCHINQ